MKKKVKLVFLLASICGGVLASECGRGEPASAVQSVLSPPEVILILDPTVLETGDSVGAARIRAMVTKWVAQVPFGGAIKVFKVDSGLTSQPPEVLRRFPKLRDYHDSISIDSSRSLLADSIGNLYYRWWYDAHLKDSVQTSCIRSSLYRVQRSLDGGPAIGNRYLVLVSDLLESCTERNLVAAMEKGNPQTLQSPLLPAGSLSKLESLFLIQVQSRFVNDPQRDMEVRHLWTELFLALGVKEGKLLFGTSLETVPWSP